MFIKLNININKIAFINYSCLIVFHSFLMENIELAKNTKNLNKKLYIENFS